MTQRYCQIVVVSANLENGRTTAVGRTSSRRHGDLDSDLPPLLRISVCSLFINLSCASIDRDIIGQRASGRTVFRLVLFVVFAIGISQHKP